MEPKISSVNGLKQYVLRKLGYPSHAVEITDDQLQDAIDDTLDDYVQFAYAGVTDRYVPVQLLNGVQDYVLPYNTIAVLGVMDQNMSMIGSNMPSNLFSLNQFIAADLYRPGVGKIDLIGYETINQLTASIDIIFGKKITFDYNCVTKLLHLHGLVPYDMQVIIQMYQTLDMNGTAVSADINGTPIAPSFIEQNIYNEKWIKRMATARAKLQWGNNIGLKYQGSILPNGGTLNGSGIIDQANAEITTLTEELHNVYELPTDFYVG